MASDLWVNPGFEWPPIGKYPIGLGVSKIPIFCSSGYPTDSHFQFSRRTESWPNKQTAAPSQQRSPSNRHSSTYVFRLTQLQLCHDMPIHCSQSKEQRKTMSIIL